MSKINKVLYNVDQTAGTNGTTADERKLARKNIGLDEVVGHAATASESGIAPLDEDGLVPSENLPAYPEATTDAPGIVTLKNSIDDNESCADKAVTPKAVKDEIDSLDNTPNGTSGTGTNVTVKVTQTKGKITGVTVTDDTATANHTHSLSVIQILPTDDYDYRVIPSGYYRLTAGGSSKIIQVAKQCETLSADYWEPNGFGEFDGQMVNCPASKTLYMRTNNKWMPIAGTHHKMIIQIKYLKLNGQTVPRNILCDKQDYTENSGPGESIQFNPIDPYLYAYWYNRGDSFELGKEVSNDPWGDGYPLWITEYQALKDGNGDWYCTNLNAVRYDRGTLQNKWFNNITDEETGIMYLECQSW
jgi:hypothetical protein